MKKISSFQALILAGCLAVTVGTLAFVAVFVQEPLEQEMVKAARQSLGETLAVALDYLAVRWRPELSLAESDRLAESLGRKINSRVTLIAPDGRVVGDSDVPADKLAFLENHAQRPEVIQALAEGFGTSVRRSATVYLDFLYTAGRLGPPENPGLVVRLARPLEEVDKARGRVHRAVLGALAVGLALSLGAAWLVAFVLCRPLKRLNEAALDLAAGNLGRRLTLFPANEIGQLSRVLNQMAAALEQKMADLSRLNARLATTLATMVEGVLVMDGQGRVVLANQALIKALDLPGDPAGRRVPEIIRHPGLIETIEAVLAGQERAGVEVRPTGLAGRVFQVEVARFSGGHPDDGLVAVFHDLTERVRLEQARRDLVANASHELRTPVTSIRGAAESLLAGGLEEPRMARKFTGTVLRQALRIQKLVEELLRLNQLETGRAKPAPRDLPAADLAEAALAVVLGQAEEKGVELVQEIGKGILVKADGDQLTPAVAELLVNAVRHTPAGGKVALRIYNQEGRSIIEVADAGPGIPPEHLPRIFERFYRVDPGRSRDQGGSGLGLALVKHVARAHGGQVEAESFPGRGSVFRIILPGN